jgi:allantoicase
MVLRSHFWASAIASKKTFPSTENAYENEQNRQFGSFSHVYLSVKNYK